MKDMKSGTAYGIESAKFCYGGVYKLRDIFLRRNVAEHTNNPSLGLFAYAFCGFFKHRPTLREVEKNQV